MAHQVLRQLIGPGSATQSLAGAWKSFRLCAVSGFALIYTGDDYEFRERRLSRLYHFRAGRSQTLNISLNDVSGKLAQQVWCWTRTLLPTRMKFDFRGTFKTDKD
ncbi:UNVERIFIED_CONTAM: hypothetical protein K2H54_025790 [Gekko kuhli]